VPESGFIAETDLIRRFPHLAADGWRRQLVRQALRWFDRHARDLPWRRRPTWYRVWISEIMLQQTQVATVVPYFRRFLQRFSTVRRLASADESEVLKSWEGLGYYRRARQLHQAARRIVDDHAGQCPTTVEQWRSLPGIGRYTAGAILSIACGQAEPILEGNTQRLFSRLLGLENDPRSATSQRQLWSFARWVLATRRPGDLNQALMEIGNQVCTPALPRCHDCPLARLCPTLAQAAQSRIPKRSRRPRITRVRQAVVVIRRGNKWLLHRRPPGGRWGGLWDFLRIETSGVVPNLESLAAEVRQQTGLEVELRQTALRACHQVTRFRIEIRGILGTPVSGQLVRSGAEWAWFTARQLRDLPLNTTGRKIARHWLDSANSATAAR
jgi:A/G-specific adenine glycosylase